MLSAVINIRRQNPDTHGLAFTDIIYDIVLVVDRAIK